MAAGDAADCMCRYLHDHLLSDPARPNHFGRAERQEMGGTDPVILCGAKTRWPRGHHITHGDIAGPDPVTASMLAVRPAC